MKISFQVCTFKNGINFISRFRVLSQSYVKSTLDEYKEYEKSDE